MELSSPKVSVAKDAASLFSFLEDIPNFKDILPQDHQKFEVISASRFLFQLSGLPQIVLDKQSSVPHNSIVFGAASDKLSFTLEIVLKSLDASCTECQFLFQGDFNPMMQMMIKKPIVSFLESLAANLSKL